MSKALIRYKGKTAGGDAAKAPLLTGVLDLGCEAPDAILYRPDSIK
jgi:hypothetical protein